MQIRNIFFDMGSTLVHRPIDRQVGFAVLLRRFGYDVSDQDMLDAYERARKAVPHSQEYKQTMDQLNQRLFTKLKKTMENLGLSNPEEIVSRLMASDSNPIQPFPDTVPALEEAKSRGFRLGIISNWDPELMQFCKTIGIYGYFDTIIASRALGYRKPEPEIFVTALTSIGGTAEESVHIGDSIGSDAVGAMGVEIQPIVIDRKGLYQKLFCPVIKSLTQVLTTINSL